MRTSRGRSWYLRITVKHSAPRVGQETLFCNVENKRIMQSIKLHWLALGIFLYANTDRSPIRYMHTQCDSVGILWSSSGTVLLLTESSLLQFASNS